MRNNKLRLAVLMVLSSSQAMAGDVVFDGSLPGTTAGALTPSNGTFTINEGAGYRAPNTTNLFHSFTSFNIAAGETARFTGSASITNIISRVTGGSPTTIAGTVQSTITGANFWFVNPAGIIVGNGAAFDVSGTLGLGAADYIQFGDSATGPRWYAFGGSAPSSNMLSVNPTDFGFLPQGGTTGTFQSNGWQLVEKGNENTSANSPQLVDHNFGDIVIAGAGGVTLSNSELQTYGFFQTELVNGTPTSVQRDGGDIRITSQTGPISLEANTVLRLASSDQGATIGNINISTGGNFSMRTGAHLEAHTRSNSPGKHMTISARDLSITGLGADSLPPTIGVYTLNDGVGPELRLIGSQSVTLTNTRIYNQVNSDDAGSGFTGRTGDTVIRGGTVTLFDSSITSDFAPPNNPSVPSVGTAGGVSITGTSALRVDNSDIVVNSNTGSAGGSGGDISLSAPNIYLDNGTNIRSINQGGSARSGRILISGSSSVNANIGPGGGALSLAARTTLQSGGNGVLGIPQDIRIEGGAIKLARTDIDATTFSSSVDPAIALANVQLESFGGNVELLDITRVGTTTRGLRNAGDVSIIAAGNVCIDGASSVQANSNQGRGAAGDITVQGSGVLISDQSLISADYNNPSTANGPGSIIIRATGTSAETTPQTNLTSATAGVVRIVDSAVTANNIGGRDGALRGNITIGGALTASPTDPNATRTDAVVIAGSVVSTNVSAAGRGDDILINGARGVWIERSQTGGYQFPISSIPIDPRGADTARSLITATTNISAASAGSITVQGGALGVSIENSNIDTTNNASGGAAGSSLVPSNISVTANGGHAFLNDAIVNANTTNVVSAGTITVNANTVDIVGGKLTASTSGTGNAGSIIVNALGAAGPGNTAALRIRDGAALSSSARTLPSGGAPGSVGDAGDVSLTATAGTISVSGTRDSATLGTGISTSADASAGAAGEITLTGNNISVSGAVLTTTVASAAPGAAAVTLNATNAAAVSGSRLDASTTGAAASGNVTINARTVDVSGSDLRASTIGSGAAGNVSVTATGADSANIAALRVRDGAFLASNALGGTSRSANAGSVSLTASLGTVSVAGTRNGATFGTQIATNAGPNAGAAGQVTLSGNNISVSGAELTTTTASTVSLAMGQDPATVRLGATNAVTVSGSRVDASTTGAAQGGDVTIVGNAVLISENSTITAQTGGTGNAGDISVTSGSPTLPQVMIGSQSQPPVLPGAGGLTIDSSTLTSSTSGRGAAGDITLSAQGPLLLANANVLSRSTLATALAGAAGSIQLNGRSLSIVEGSNVSATIAGGVAGTALVPGTPLANITLNVFPGVTPGMTTAPIPPLLINNSTITTGATIADGGNIVVNASGSPVQLTNATIAASAGATGRGGNIGIANAEQTILQRSQILARAVNGNGGAININLNPGALFIRDSETAINADSSAGNNGTVSISSPNTDLNSAIKPQDVDATPPLELGGNACMAANADDRSTFVRENRGGVAASPDGYLLGRPMGAEQSARTAATNFDMRDTVFASVVTINDPTQVRCP